MAGAFFESLCIRAIIDANWKRAKKTVADHFREAKFMVSCDEALVFLPMPSLGPFPLGRHNDMLQAILLKMFTMEKGHSKDWHTVKIGTPCMI